MEIAFSVNDDTPTATQLTELAELVDKTPSEVAYLIVAKDLIMNYALIKKALPLAIKQS